LFDILAVHRTHIEHLARSCLASSYPQPSAHRHDRASSATARLSLNVAPGSGPIGATRVRVGERRGANIGKVAAARKLLTLVFYGLRDGHIRCLARPA
jgi:hypothetical protein